MISNESRCTAGNDPIANVTNGWGRSPSGVVFATARTSVAAAMWNGRSRTADEVSAQPNDRVSSIGIACATFTAQTSIDGRVIYDGIVHAGCFNIVRSGERPRGVHHGAWAMLHMYVPDRLLETLGSEQSPSRKRRPIELINPIWAADEAISRIGHEVATEMRSSGMLSRLRMDALSQDLAIILLRSYSNFGASTTGGRRSLAGLGRRQLARAMDAMDAQIDGNIGLDELAELCGVSPAYFSRAFKAATGVPPFTWLLRRRIARAQELLLRDDLSIADVALAVGFAAQSPFTTAFRRTTGSTPAAWRREHRTASRCAAKGVLSGKQYRDI